MEKEKKPGTKPETTKKASAATQPSGAKTAPKKTAARKKPGPVALPANGVEPKKVAPRKKGPVKLAANKISHEEIAKLAHRYWAERGHKHGHHVEDWLRAERELLGKAS